MADGYAEYDGEEQILRKAAMIAVGNGGDPGWFLDLPVCYRDTYLKLAVEVSREMYGRGDDDG